MKPRDPAPNLSSADASARAHNLMRDILSPEEYGQVVNLGYLDVPSPSRNERRYRIARRSEGLVWIYEHDQPIEWLCVQPTEDLPADDVVVLHKLAISANEEEYLATANRIPLEHWEDPFIQMMARILAVPWQHPIRLRPLGAFHN